MGWSLFKGFSKHKSPNPSFSCWNQRQPAICKTNGITVKLRVMAGASFQTLFRWSIWKFPTGWPDDLFKPWAWNRLKLMEWWGWFPNASNKNGYEWMHSMGTLNIFKMTSTLHRFVTISLGKLKVCFSQTEAMPRSWSNPGSFVGIPIIGIPTWDQSTNLRLDLLDCRLKHTPTV